MVKPNIAKSTRKDVAEFAGVSAQTVSYIINGTRKFSPNLENRVREAVKILNYEPNAAAKNLVKKKSYSLCVVVHDITNPIFNEIMAGFQEAALKKNYVVTVCEGRKNIEYYVNNLISRDFEGVFLYVLSSYEDLGFIERFIRSGVKIVLDNKLNNDFINKHASTVSVDHYSGMHKIIDYLADLGHEEIVYLSGLDKEAKFDKRFSGFVDAYRKRFNKPPLYFEDLDNLGTKVHHGRHMAKRLLQSEVPFTAIVTTNDLMAYGVAEVLHQNKFNIPNDVSLVGIDDLMFSSYFNPSLTTLGFDKIKYGEKVFDILYSQIHEDKKYEEVLPMDLVIRQSTAKRK
jgi:DNA-binding LacI/PurR family transcriptional regulator